MSDEAREAAWAAFVDDDTYAPTIRGGFASGFDAGVAEGIRQAPSTREVLIAFYRLAYDEGSEGTLRFLASRYRELFDEEIDDALGNPDD